MLPPVPLVAHHLARVASLEIGQGGAGSRAVLVSSCCSACQISESVRKSLAEAGAQHPSWALRKPGRSSRKAVQTRLDASGLGNPWAFSVLLALFEKPKRFFFFLPKF